MATYTAPTTRTTGALISASIWNTDIVENLKYFKDAPVFDGDISVGDDIFLTSTGAVINFASGDVTITHSTNTLTFAGAASGYIFNDGNVGIGVTPGSVKLDILGATAIRTASVDTNATTKEGKYVFRHYTNAEEDVMFAYVYSTSTANEIYIGGGASSQNAATQISFSTAANNTTVAGTERLRITSGGNVGIGTASPAYRLDVNGSGQIGSTILQEATAFLSSSGNTMVGWSSGIAGYTNGTLILQTRSSAACPIVFVTGNGAGADRGRVTDTGEWWIGYTSDQGAYLLQVNSQIFATNATIATSDARFKTDVHPVSSGLAAINALKPVSFQWKKHPIHNFIDGTDVGFLAQDVQQALAGREYVSAVVTKNGTGENEFLGMADSKLIPLLVAAVQELSAEVNALKAH